MAFPASRFAALTCRLLAALATAHVASANIEDSSVKLPSAREWLQAARTGKCNQPLLETLGWNACQILGKEDEPVLESELYDVSYVSHALDGGSALVHSAASYVGVTHSGIFLEGKSGGDVIVLEYFALNFMGALTPSVGKNGIVFDNKAMVGWYPYFNRSEWPQVQRVGVASADVVSKWFKWVPQWAASHKTYSAFAVWSATEGGAANDVSHLEYFKDRICHTFSEDGLKELYSLGADFKEGTALCRNYMSFIGSGAPRPVDEMEDRLELLQFYGTLTMAWQLPMDEFRKVFGHFLGNQKESPHAYVVDDNGAFYKVPLMKPFVRSILLTPMRVPWSKATNCDAFKPSLVATAPTISERSALLLRRKAQLLEELHELER